MDSKRNDNATYIALTTHLEELLSVAQPRLARLAQKQGVPPDGLDDVVQETLVEAWRHLEHLRNPDSFDAWLNGICRNVSLRWNRTHTLTGHRQINFSSLITEKDKLDSDELDIPDPFALDPAEELQQQDLETLLERAMSYLPPTARQALELHYLTEIPQNETARQLGMTINALEVRLHRARRRLRQVLSNQLREDAIAFGMVLDDDDSQGWRDTSLWCMFCGMHRLQGWLETRPNACVSLRLRCPSCNQFGEREWIVSGGTPELRGMKAFRPAFHRSMSAANEYWSNTQTRQQCAFCKAPVHMQLLEPNEAFLFLRPWQG